MGKNKKKTKTNVKLLKYIDLSCNLSIKNLTVVPSLTSKNCETRNKEVRQVGTHSNGESYTQCNLLKIRKFLFLIPKEQLCNNE